MPKLDNIGIWRYGLDILNGSEGLEHLANERLFRHLLWVHPIKLNAQNNANLNAGTTSGVKRGRVCAVIGDMDSATVSIIYQTRFQIWLSGQDVTDFENVKLSMLRLLLGCWMVV